MGSKTRKAQALTSSLEDYLEAIFEILAQQGFVRSKDIAERLKVSKPSVTGALQTLSKKKLVKYTPYSNITLTAKGYAIAARVAQRHVVLLRFYTDILLVEKKEANEVACKMEHIVSENVLNRLTTFAAYVCEHKSTCVSWMFDKKTPT
jgi:DtxR family Mn-dependent transcriptional regulator